MPETVDAAGTIGVAIRIRPFNGKERARKDLQCWSFKDETASRLVLPEDARAALQDKVQKLKTEGYTSPNFGEDSCFGADACTGDIYAAVGLSRHPSAGSCTWAAAHNAYECVRHAEPRSPDPSR